MVLPPTLLLSSVHLGKGTHDSARAALTATGTPVPVTLLTGTGKDRKSNGIMSLRTYNSEKLTKGYWVSTPKKKKKR